MRGHSSLLSNLWCTAAKPEAPRIYTEHLSMILRTRIRLKRMSAQKNDCLPFLPKWGRCHEGAKRALVGKLNKNRGKVTLHAEYMKPGKPLPSPTSPLRLPSPSHLRAIPTQPIFAISEEIREAAVILWYNYRYR